jgi:quercetin dioxygenase-like cupin family protein
VILLRPGEGETVTEKPERTIRILLDHELADVTWSRYEAGERGPGPHVHRRHVDAFYVLTGELEFGVGPDVAPVRAPAGTLVVVPQLVVHTFRNASDARATYLNVHAPSCGFAAHLRGDSAGFDSEDPPSDGGRDPADVVVTPAGGGERFERENRTIAILGDMPELSVLEIAFDPDFDVSPHTHDDHVDAFFVLDGDVAFAPAAKPLVRASGPVEGVRGNREVPPGRAWLRTAPGTFTAAPPGAVHGFRGTNGGRSRVLNLHTPDAGFANSVRRH